MIAYNELREQAKEEPIVADLPPLSGFYLPEVAIYPSIRDFERDLYDPQHQFDTDVVINSDTRDPKYSQFNKTLDPFGPKLNSVIDWKSRKQYDRIKDQLLCQSEIPEYVTNNTGFADVIILVVIDGLSFEKIRPFVDSLPGETILTPVFVNGVTVTEQGFLRVIRGNSIQSINARLNAQDFTDHLGFTYWEANGRNELSAKLHRGMREDRVHRIRDFSETHDIITDHGLSSPTYIQITRMGLDQESHNRKEQPNINHEIQTLIDDLSELFRTVSELVDRFRIFVTADHGILWRHELEDDLEVIAADTTHHRYIEGPTNINKGIEYRMNSEPSRTALAYPYMTRDFKHTEWGVHGGLSYQESIIPLIEITSR